ncbi:MAG: DUF1501 domain-containing protein [Planctomycetota bacterium]|jgi:uncharacterized protein (DUF1501 family)
MANKNVNLSRRRFLRGAALGAAAVTVNPMMSARPVRGEIAGIPGRFMVVINLLGGNDGLNMVIPAHLTSYYERRPNIKLEDGNLPAGETLHDLDGSYKLHYSLSNMKSMWDQSELHIVQKVAYPNPNQSHFTSQDIWSYGVRDPHADGDGRGWLGRYADIYCPGEPLGVISVGLGKRHDFASDVTSPLILSSVPSFKVDTDFEFAADHALRLAATKDILGSDPVPTVDPSFSIFSAGQQAYDLVDQVQEDTAGWVAPQNRGGELPAYGTDALGRYMQTISQLLEAQGTFGTKVFYTGYGGFDTHSGQHSAGSTNRHESLMERLDAAIGTFKADMSDRGMWGNTVIVVISEFGRRIYENGSVGTDHGHANCVFVAGGNVKGKSQVGAGMTGSIIESDLATGTPGNISANPRTLAYQYDFRDIYTEIMQAHLGVGNAAANIFPDPNYTPSPTDLANII